MIYGSAEDIGPARRCYRCDAVWSGPAVCPECHAGATCHHRLLGRAWPNDAGTSSLQAAAPSTVDLDPPGTTSSPSPEPQGAGSSSYAPNSSKSSRSVSSV